MDNLLDIIAKIVLMLFIIGAICVFGLFLWLCPEMIVGFFVIVIVAWAAHRMGFI